MTETRRDLPSTLLGLLEDKPRLALYGLLTVSLIVNVALIVGGDDGVEAPAPVAAAPAVEEAPVDEAALVIDEAPEAAAPAAAAPAPVVAAAWQVTRAEVTHSIARTFQLALGEDGPAVAAEFSRPFVWDFDMRRDLMKGDGVAAVWRKTGEGEAAEYDIAAARLRSGKKGDLRVYAFTAPGDTWPSFWKADGTEVEGRLVNGPIDTYEQVTALLKDRPDHAGMDFKTPVGTVLKSPKAGKVLRSNWNWRFNGNSLEIEFTDGVVAKFLHLSENRVKAGDTVSAGQIIGLTGNTGRSTAPHLHYQIERGSKVLDPIDYHGTTHRTLPESAMPAFRQVVADADALLSRDDG